MKGDEIKVGDILEDSRYSRERLFHLGHLPVFELVDRVKEEHDSGLIPFHRCHRPDEGFATAVG